jgi:hypothetical protein
MMLKCLIYFWVFFFADLLLSSFKVSHSIHIDVCWVEMNNITTLVLLSLCYSIKCLYTPWCILPLQLPLHSVVMVWIVVHSVLISVALSIPLPHYVLTVLTLCGIYTAVNLVFWDVCPNFIKTSCAITATTHKIHDDNVYIYKRISLTMVK